MTPAATLIGMPKTELDTPALLVDLDVMEANIARIASTCRQHGVGWRPHLKGQKTVEIIRKELAAGAVGITCAKLGEAEVMAAAGNPERPDRQPDRRADQDPAPDRAPRTRTPLSRWTAWRTRPSWPTPPRPRTRGAGRDRGRYRDEAGRRRSGGVRRGAGKGHRRASRLAVPRADRLGGPRGHHRRCEREGADSRCRDRPADRQRGRLPASRLCGRDRELRRHRLVPLLRHAAGRDRRAGRRRDLQRHALSRPLPHRLPVRADADGNGHEPADHDADRARRRQEVDERRCRHALPIGLPGVRSLRLSAEHATIELEAPTEQPRIGDRVEFIVGYSDTTVHLHEEIVGIRRGSGRMHLARRRARPAEIARPL